MNSKLVIFLGGIPLLLRLTNRKFYYTRNGKVFANLSASLIFKAINMVISFMMVPITLDYLDKTRYGLWAALSSVLSWFFIFDIGMGHGLRNKFTELKAKGEYGDLKGYVSTTYFLFGAIAVALIIVFFMLNIFIDWPKVLNAPAGMGKELTETVFIVFMVLCVSFVLKLINNILSADLKNAVSDGISVVAHLISFVGIIILSRITEASILKYALLYTGSNLFVMLIASLYFFSGRYKQISPSWSHVDLSLRHNLLSVGVKFFFIQIAGIVLYHTSSLILINLTNPETVTDYNITQKYYSLVTMAFLMMVQPLWTAYGDAYHRGDYQWIKSTFSRLRKLWLGMVVLLLVSLLAQDMVFRIWLKGRVQFDVWLSTAFVVYGAITLWTAIYNPLLNATAKLTIQLRLLMITVPLFIPLCIVLVQYAGLGAKGIVFALIATSLPSAILYTIQCAKILSGAEGIWNK